MTQPFQLQGFNLTSWFSGGFSDHSLDQLAIDYVKSEGSNVITLDVMVNFNDDGTIIPISAANSQQTNIDDIRYVIDLAHQNGLQVILKPHVTLANIQQNRMLSNTDSATFSSSSFFRDWGNYLTDLIHSTATQRPEILCIGTEFNVFDWNHVEEWSVLITSLRAIYGGQLTYDSLFSVYSSVKDINDVSFWSLLDFISCSLYVPLSINQNASLESLNASWLNNTFGDISDIVEYLHSISVRYGKQIMALEGGYQSYSGALSDVTADPNPSRVVDNQVQANGLQSYLDTLSKYGGDWLKGVAFWEVRPYEMTPTGLAGIWNTQWFTTYLKPGADVIREYFTGSTIYSNSHYYQSEVGGNISASFGNDHLHVHGDAGAAYAVNGEAHASTASTFRSSLVVNISGNIIDGIAPAISAYVNGVKIGSAQLNAIPGSYVDSAGIQWTDIQHIQFDYVGAKVINDLKITLDNPNSGVPENTYTYISSITLGGISLNQGDASYYPAHGTLQIGRWDLWDGGYTTLDATPYNRHLATLSTTSGVIDGGSGSDTAIFIAPASDYLVIQNSASSFTVSDRYGIDPIQVLRNVERIQFSDSLLNIATSHIGSAGSDTLAGSNFNDSLQGGGGNDILDGGVGIDTALFSGGRSGYAVTRTPAGYALQDLAGSEGTDTLTSIERLQFSDHCVALDLGITQSSGEAALLLGAVLGKNMMLARPQLLGVLIGLFDQGLTLQQLSGAILRLPIWGLLTGHAAPTNTEIANYLLTTVNGHLPDVAMLSTAVVALNSETGATQGNYLADLASNAANQTQVNLAGLQQMGLDYI